MTEEKEKKKKEKKGNLFTSLDKRGSLNGSGFCSVCWTQTGRCSGDTGSPQVGRVHVPQGRSTDGLSQERVRAKNGGGVGGGGRSPDMQEQSHLLARTAPFQTLVLSPR